MENDPIFSLASDDFHVCQMTIFGDGSKKPVANLKRVIYF